MIRDKRISYKKINGNSKIECKMAVISPLYNRKAAPNQPAKALAKWQRGISSRFANAVIGSYRPARPQMAANRAFAPTRRLVA